MSTQAVAQPPTPAGALVVALTPTAYADYDVITQVTDRLPPGLTVALAHLVQMAKARAVAAAKPATIVLVDDELAFEARSRLGYMSAADPLPVLDEGHESSGETPAERFAEDTGPGTYQAAD